MGNERALHRVDRDLLEVVDAEAERLVSEHQLLRHRRVAHEAVVGVQRHPEVVPVVDPEGVLLDVRGRAGVDVAAQANLERNAFVENVLGQISHLDDLGRIVAVEPDVLDQPRGVADAVGAAPLDRLPDAFLAERLAGVNRDVEILPLNVVERIDVLFGREPALFAGQIESDDTALAKIDGQFGHLL